MDTLSSGLLADSLMRISSGGQYVATSDRSKKTPAAAQAGVLESSLRGELGRDIPIEVVNFLDAKFTALNVRGCISRRNSVIQIVVSFAAQVVELL